MLQILLYVSKTSHTVKRIKYIFNYLKTYNYVSYLIHENIKDACGDRQREEGEEEGEEPGRGVHGCVETLGSKMDIQLWKLLLRYKKLEDFKTKITEIFKSTYKEKEMCCM